MYFDWNLFPTDHDPERCHDVLHPPKRPFEKGPFAVYGDGAVVKDGHKGYAQSCEKARLARMQYVQAGMGGTGAVDGEGSAVTAYPGPEGLGHEYGRFAVFARGIMAQVAAAFGKGRADYGPLGETLRSRHLQVSHTPEAAEIPIYPAVHLFECDLS